MKLDTVGETVLNDGGTVCCYQPRGYSCHTNKRNMQQKIQTKDISSRTGRDTVELYNDALE